MNPNPSRLYRCIISPGIAEIRSNVKFIPDFYPITFGSREVPRQTSNQICITFLVGDVKQPQGLLQFTTMGGEKGKDGLYYERALLGSLKAKMELRDLHAHPKITVNRTYYKLGRIRVASFYSIGTLLRDILSAKLLMQGYVPLHGAAFSTSEEGILIVGPPCTGKTVILSEAIRQGFKYVADELVVADSEACLHAGSISTLAYELEKLTNLRSYQKKRFWRAEFLNFLSSKIPLAGILWRPPYISISSLIPEVEFSAQAKTRFIFILIRGSSQIRKLPPAEALQMLISLNKLEFSYAENEILLCYSLLNPWLDFSQLRHKEEQLLQKMVEQSSCYLCSAPQPSQYFSLIRRKI